MIPTARAKRMASLVLAKELTWLTRSIIWSSVVIAVQQFVVQEPLRRNKDANSPLALLG
jgi:hypothetical protein